MKRKKIVLKEDVDMTSRSLPNSGKTFDIMGSTKEVTGHGSDEESSITTTVDIRKKRSTKGKSMHASDEESSVVATTKIIGNSDEMRSKKGMPKTRIYQDTLHGSDEESSIITTNDISDKGSKKGKSMHASDEESKNKRASNSTTLIKDLEEAPDDVRVLPLDYLPIESATIKKEDIQRYIKWMEQEDGVHFTESQTNLFQSLRVTMSKDLKNVRTYAKKVVQDELV